MKACVVGIKGSFAAVLSDDGRIMKTKNKNYAIGQVIEMKKHAVHFSVKTAAAAACAAVVVLLSSVTAWAYYTPCGYVSLDVNPSIEYSVNRFDRVLSVRAVNNDGADIIDGLNLNNEAIDQAVKVTVGKIRSKGYLKDSGGIMISASSGNRQASQNLAKELQNAAVQAAKDSGAPVEVEAVGVGFERVQEARKLGTTPGKLNLVQKLQASAGNETIDVSEWLKKPVKDIMKAIKNARQVSKLSGTDAPAAASASENSASSAGITEDPQAKTQTPASSAQSASSQAGGKQNTPKQQKKSNPAVSSGMTENNSSGEKTSSSIGNADGSASDSGKKASPEDGSDSVTNGGNMSGNHSPVAGGNGNSGSKGQAGAKGSGGKK